MSELEPKLAELRVAKAQHLCSAGAEHQATLRWRATKRRSAFTVNNCPWLSLDRDVQTTLRAPPTTVDYEPRRRRSEATALSLEIGLTQAADTKRRAADE